MELESLDIPAYVLFFVYVVSTYFSKWKSCIVGLRGGRIPTPIILFRVNNDTKILKFLIFYLLNNE